MPVPISHEQEVKIYLPIQLTPSFLAFPHHPLDILYQYRLQVTLTKSQSNCSLPFKSCLISNSIVAGKHTHKRHTMKPHEAASHDGWENCTCIAKNGTHIASYSSLLRVLTIQAGPHICRTHIHCFEYPRIRCLACFSFVFL